MNDVQQSTGICSSYKLTFPPFLSSTLPLFHPSSLPPFLSSTLPLFHPSSLPPFLFICSSYKLTFRPQLVIFFSDEAGNPTAVEDKEHRYRRPHRRGQDHRHRAHPLLHRQDLQDGRGARRHRHHGLPAAGAGAGHHHHLRGDHVLLERPRDTDHRYAGTRRFHHRGGKVAPGARRHGRGLLGGRGGRAPVGDRLAPGGQVPCAEDRVHQQARQARGRFFPGPRYDGGETGDQPHTAPDTARQGRRLLRRGRPDHDEGRRVG